MQTTYAELLDRCRATAFQSAFPQDGTFVPKTIKGKRYWYFQQSSDAGRAQKYVGPETPELLKQISEHKDIREDARERRALVSTLIRSFALPRPVPAIGDIVAALANAGVFRLRGILVGTAAYQTYAPMLGARLPLQNLQTADVDIAQFKNVSVAVDDRTPPVLEVLKSVDKTFRAVPHVHDQHNVTSYLAKGGMRVEFLTPNEGPDTDVPQPLPAFQTDAEPLRFLDFLIHDPEEAVVLHGTGVYVLVPSPERYAVHKLIISRRRRAGAAKRDKDIQQSAALLDILVEKRSHDLKLVWDEAFSRGQTWRQLLIEGLSLLPPATRDLLIKTLDKRRNIIVGLDLTFRNEAPHYDFERDAVTFVGKAQGHTVLCAISREALDDNFVINAKTSDDRVEAFRQNRSSIEQMARTKYLSWPVEEPETVSIKTLDVPKLRQRNAAS
jgi:hypothetical protein